MKGNGKKIGIGIAIAAVIVVAVLLVFSNKVEDFHDKYEGVDLYADVAGMERQGAYTGYLNEHAGAACPAGDIEIDLFSCTGEGMEKMSSYEGESNVLMTEVGSSVSWSVDVPEAGFYNLYMEYLLPESRGVAAERELLINGEVPFEDARNISFTRIWKDGGNVRVDNQGNEIRPTQVEYYDWQYAFFRDDMGYITEPYRFYLEKGTNEITINGENEPIALKKLVVTGIKDRDTYAEYIAKQPQVNASDTAKKYEQVIQGETSTLRSESSLYAKYDRSSPSTQPNSVTHTVLNYVGGDAWRSSGQWIEWEFEVPEDGYYNIMVK